MVNIPFDRGPGFRSPKKLNRTSLEAAAKKAVVDNRQLAIMLHDQGMLLKDIHERSNEALEVIGPVAINVLEPFKKEFEKLRDATAQFANWGGKTPEKPEGEKT